MGGHKQTVYRCSVSILCYIGTPYLCKRVSQTTVKTEARPDCATEFGSHGQLRSYSQQGIIEMGMSKSMLARPRQVVAVST